MEETKQVEKPKAVEGPAKPAEVSAAGAGSAGARKDDSTVYVGKKGVMGYVLAVVTQFNNGANNVTVKARGKLISRAVDVVEIVRHRFMPDAKVKKIDIKTEELTSEDGSKSKVSAIEIILQK